MLDRSLPIGVFIHYRGQNLIKMIAVCTSDICSENLRPTITLDAVLNIAGVEYEVGLRTSYAHQQIVSNELDEEEEGNL